MIDIYPAKIKWGRNKGLKRKRLQLIGLLKMVYKIKNSELNQENKKDTSGFESKK